MALLINLQPLIFHLLHRLSGIHPFQIEDEELMLDNIENNRWQWLGDSWKTVSDSAKDLILKLMEPDPAKRLTVDQALQHPWIRVRINLLSFFSELLTHVRWRLGRNCF